MTESHHGHMPFRRSKLPSITCSGARNRGVLYHDQDVPHAERAGSEASDHVILRAISWKRFYGAAVADTPFSPDRYQHPDSRVPEFPLLASIIGADQAIYRSPTLRSLASAGNFRNWHRAYASSTSTFDRCRPDSGLPVPPDVRRHGLQAHGLEWVKFSRYAPWAKKTAAYPPDSDAVLDGDR